MPGFAIGHNDHIAWGVTNLGPDVQDLFLEKIDPQNPNRYLADGEWVDMNIVEEKIYLKGREEPILWAARSTRHGPLISDVQNTASVVALPTPSAPWPQCIPLWQATVAMMPAKMNALISPIQMSDDHV